MKIFLKDKNLIISFKSWNKPTPAMVTKCCAAFIAAANFASGYAIFQDCHKFAVATMGLGMLSVFISTLFSEEDKPNVNQPNN